MNVPAKLEVRSFALWHNSVGVFGGLRTPNLGKQEAGGGREWYRSKERW